MEQIDDLQNGYYIIQDSQKFRFGVDAVLLSNFVAEREKKAITALDLGTGNGIIPVLLYAKIQAKVTGLELQEESVALANKSVAYNKLQEHITIQQGDIKEVSTILKGKKFDAVVTNPPYMNTGHGLLNEAKSVAIARHEIACTLSDVVAAAAYVLNHGSSLYMIHRPHRLSEIIETLKVHKLEPKDIQFVHSRIDSEATMVMIHAKRGAKAFCKISAPVIMY